MRLDFFDKDYVYWGFEVVGKCGKNWNINQI